MTGAADPQREHRLQGIFAASLAGATIGASGGSIVVAEWSDPGGGWDPPRYIAPLHIHRCDDEAWYVLEGTLCVRVGDDDVEVAAGGAVIVPAGTPHTFWNPRAQPVRYVLIMTPRISGLIDALHELPERTPQTVSDTFAAFESDVLGWP